MGSKRAIQYTVRGIPERVDAALRREANAQGISLNQATLRTIARGLALHEQPGDTILSC